MGRYKAKDLDNYPSGKTIKGSSKKDPRSLGNKQDWDDWLHFFVDNANPTASDYAESGYGSYNNKTGKYVTDHHDKDAYRRDQARTYTTDWWHHTSGSSQWGRGDILGREQYESRHRGTGTKGLMADQTGREWEDHKYIDKVTTKTGRIRYIYELPSGNRVSYAQNSPQQKEAQRRGKDEYGHSNDYRKERKDIGTELKKDGERLINNIKKGKTSKIKSGIEDIINDTGLAAEYAIDQIGDKATDAIWSAANSVSNGLEKVNDLLNSAISNTPISDLFK